MKYIEEILQPDEKIIFSSTLSWVTYLPGILLWVVAAVVFAIGSDNYNRGVWYIAALVIALLAAYFSLRAWFNRWTTEIDVTDRRVVYKHGFINRHTVEMNMDKVESVDVDQSILGRLLDYGDITIRGTGETWETLKMIGAPLKFRNHVTAR